MRSAGARAFGFRGRSSGGAGAAPGQVTGLKLTPSSGAMSITWDEPADNGSAITSYVVEANINGAGFSTVGAPSVTSLSHTSLTNGVTHQYRVSAVNGAGTGTASRTETDTPRVISAGPATIASMGTPTQISSANLPQSNNFTAPASAVGAFVVVLSNSPDRFTATYGGAAMETIYHGTAEQYTPGTPDSWSFQTLQIFWIEDATTGTVAVAVDLPAGEHWTGTLAVGAYSVVGLVPAAFRAYSDMEPQWPTSFYSAAASLSVTVDADADAAILSAVIGDENPNAIPAGHTELAAQYAGFGNTQASVMEESPASALVSSTLSASTRGFRNAAGYVVVIGEVPGKDRLRIDPIRFDRVYARTLGTTSRAITFSGAYDGKQPTGIQARVVNFDTGAEVVSWTTIDPAPAEGSWSGALTVPQGSPYRLQVRRLGGSEIVSSDARFGVGIFALSYGQSNIGGMWNNASGAAVRDYAYVNQHFSGSVFSGTEFGWFNPVAPIRGFYDEVATRSGLPIVTIDASVAGSTVGALTTTGPGTRYQAMLDAVAIVGETPEYVVWKEGEADAATGNVNFRANTATLFDQMEASFGLSTGQLKFLVVNLGPSGGSETDANWQQMHDDNAALCAAEARCTYAGTSMDHALADTVHSTVLNYERQAARLGYTLSLVEGDETVSHIFEISTAVRSGSDVIVTVDHGIGTDFVMIDSTSDSRTTGATVTGFELSDDGGSSYTVVTGVRTNSTTITLDASALGTVDRLRYLYGRSPVRTGLVVDNSALQQPLEGVSEMTVT